MESTEAEVRAQAAGSEMAETRRRIAAGRGQLHGTVGPARTTVSAVAERAGVQRHTVYRHFPDDAQLFAACSAHYMADHPLPDPAPWRAIGDPDRRLARALDESTRTTSGPSRCSATSSGSRPGRGAAPDGCAAGRLPAEVVEILAAGLPARGRRGRVLRTALHHAVAFFTWRSLAADGASPESRPSGWPPGSSPPPIDIA